MKARVRILVMKRRSRIKASLRMVVERRGRTTVIAVAVRRTCTTTTRSASKAHHDARNMPDAAHHSSMPSLPNAPPTQPVQMSR
jgi:hypothetical protein